MPLDPDQEPVPAEAEQPNDEAVADASEDGESTDATDATARPHRTPEHRLAAIYRQWHAPGRPTGTFVSLVRTLTADPEGLPHLALLGVKPSAVDAAWSAWDRAQLASDATPLGRAARPLLALVPWGGRWIAGRSIGRTCLLEPTSHRTPAGAIRAAETRFELVAARRIGDLLVDLAFDLLGLEPDAADAVEAPDASPDGDEVARESDGEPR